MKLLSKLAAVLASGVVAVSAVAPFTASAIDPADTITFTAQQWQSMIGNSISGYYLSTDGTFKPITLQYQAPTSVAYTDIEGLSTTDYVGATVIWYGGYYPSDWNGTETYYPLWSFDLNLHFGNVTYFRGFTGNVLSDFLTQRYNVVPVSTLKNYYDINLGQNVSDIVQLTGRRTDSTLGGLVHMQNGYTLSALYWEEEYSNPTDLYIGTANYAVVDASGSYCWIGFVCPTINSGYVYYGHSEPPTPPTNPEYPPSVLTGEVSGVVTTDASGQTGINLDVNLEIPQETLNSHQNDTRGEMSGAMSEYHQIEDSLLSGAVSDINLDSLPLEEYDPEEFEDAEPIFSFWNINLIAVMISWVGIISFISYILFGKWV